jgi:hypothetical protein
MPADSNGNGSFVSSLGQGREAFLAEVSEYSLALGERSPEDFMQHFSCERIMKALGERPQERATILTQATSTHEKIAPRMSAEAAGETLQIALDEGITNPKQIVELFAVDDRQRYLDDAALWAFTVSGNPGSKTRKGSELDRSRKFIRHVLDRALHHKLLDQKELISALTVSRLASLLPPDILAAIIDASLNSSSKFTHADLVTVAPPEKLVPHIPVDYVWDKVIVPLVAERHGYLGGGSDTGSKKAESAPEASADQGPSVAVEEGKLEEEEYRQALESATGVVASEDLEADEEDMVLDDDDEEIHTVTDDDDVFDDLLEDGLSGPDAGSGPGVKRAEGEAPKKNANAN